jgi:hypothetical protein
MRDEAAALQPLNGRPPYHRLRELCRRVHAEGTVEIDTNRYSVPWRLIGTMVTVEVSDGMVRVLQAGAEVARHDRADGRHRRVIDARHLDGIVGRAAGGAPVPPDPVPHDPTPAARPPELLRPLAEYEELIGGGW